MARECSKRMQRCHTFGAIHEWQAEMKRPSAPSPGCFAPLGKISGTRSASSGGARWALADFPYDIPIQQI
eukprot:15441829-Alexandrium_andersonii.AAC.1